MSENTAKTQTTTAAKPRTRRAPAKKAEAAPTPAPVAEAPKKAPALKWQIEKTFEEAPKGKNQTARVGVRVYRITRTGDTYTASVQIEGQAAEILSEETFAKAYSACVDRNRTETAIGDALATNTQRREVAPQCSVFDGDS